MKTIAIANNKGGVAKSTTAQILACGLAKRKTNRKPNRVLLVDMDAQTNLSLFAGFSADDYEDPDIITTYDLFRDKNYIDIHDAIIQAPIGCDIILGSVEFTGADREFKKVDILKNKLEPVKEEYDYIVIDCPPSLGVLPASALTAADEVIIPLEADIFSLQGLTQMYGLIENIQEATNEDLKVAGLLITRYNTRANIFRKMAEELEEMAKDYGTKVFKSRIRESVIIKELHLLQSDIFKEYPKHKVTQDYKAFIDEYLKGR